MLPTPDHPVSCQLFISVDFDVCLVLWTAVAEGLWWNDLSTVEVFSVFSSETAVDMADHLLSY